MDDRINRLLDATENPDNYSDSQFQDLFNDPETKELYDLMSKSADALSQAPTPDIDSEWEKFSRKHLHKTNSPFNSFRKYFRTRNSAAVITLVLASAAVAATTVGVVVSVRNAKTTTISSSKEISVTTPQAATIDSIPNALSMTSEETVIFKNEPLENILATISQAYAAELTWNNEQAKELRLFFQWDPSLPLAEIIDRLNSFEQINILLSDNAIIVN